MSKIDDSGPAFPADSFAAQHAPGMSLRDYLAAKAMYGLLVGYITITDDEPNRHTIAARAYAQADAMLAARRPTD